MDVQTRPKAACPGDIRMRRHLFGMLALAAAMAVWPCQAAAQIAEPDWPERITIGTASAGGTYQAYGESIARLLTRSLGLPVLTRPSGGPAENIKLIEAGEIEIGFVTLGVAQQAWTGDKQSRDIRALFPMFDTPFQFIVPAGSPATGLADLAGKRVGIGPSEGTGGFFTPRIFNTLGIAADFLNGSWSGMVEEFAGENSMQ